VHLNRKGYALMAMLVERHFRQTTRFPSSWARRVRRYDVLRSLDDRESDEIVFSGDGWEPAWTGVHGSSPKGRMTLKFRGNRVDLVLGPSRGSAKVLIDGKPPSAWNLYHASRPRSKVKRGGKHATLMRVYLGPNLVPEVWTLTFTELSPNGKSFRYKLVGSVTGPDGEGTHEAPFTSNSGRIRISPRDFTLSARYAGEVIKPGLAIEWEIVPDSRDTVQASPGKKSFDYVTVADGMPCGEHELTIIPTGDSPILISVIEVHCPPLCP